MNTAATVKIWGDTAAYIYWDTRQNICFLEFESDYLKRNINLAPLQMPVSEAFNRTLPYSFPYLDKKVFSGLPLENSVGFGLDFVKLISIIPWEGP